MDQPQKLIQNFNGPVTGVQNGNENTQNNTQNNYHYPKPNEVEKVKEEIKSADIPEEHKKSILETIEEHAIDAGNGILRSGIATIADSVKFYMTGAMIASFPFLSDFITEAV